MDFSNPANLLVASIYFILVGLMAFFSLFGVYDLIRYGKSVPFSLVLALVYCFLFLSLVSHSYQTLNLLLS